ncbi:hypothetical protein EON64_14815 [archaeon]|nr:MAG: hypothetical protein EON64_14815 [archaeon]
MDDFDAVTPSLLRTAYVEAMYRALQGAWEFERLKMSWWWQLVYDVSLARYGASSIGLCVDVYGAYGAVCKCSIVCIVKLQS